MTLQTHVIFAQLTSTKIQHDMCLSTQRKKMHTLHTHSWTHLIHRENESVYVARTRILHASLLDIDVYILSLWGEFIQVYVSGQKGFYFECQSKQNLRKVNLLSNSIWIAFIAQAEHHTYNTIQSTTANTYTLAHTIWILENKSFWTFVSPSNI